MSQNEAFLNALSSVGMEIVTLRSLPGEHDHRWIVLGPYKLILRNKPWILIALQFWKWAVWLSSLRFPIRGWGCLTHTHRRPGDRSLFPSGSWASPPPLPFCLSTHRLHSAQHGPIFWPEKILWNWPLKPWTPLFIWSFIWLMCVLLY